MRPIAGEKNFEERVKRFLADQGCWFVKYWGGGRFTKAGVPDLLVCCNGRFLAVELKAPKGQPSELQLWNIDNIREAGGMACVLYPKDFEEFKRFIEEVMAWPTADTDTRRCRPSSSARTATGSST